MRLGDRRPDDHVAGVLLNPDLALQQPFYHALVVGDVARDELGRIGLAARRVVALRDLVDAAMASMKRTKSSRRWSATVILVNNDLEVTELIHSDQRAVARNEPGLREPLDARQARAPPRVRAHRPGSTLLMRPRFCNSVRMRKSSGQACKPSSSLPPSVRSARLQMSAFASTSIWIATPRPNRKSCSLYAVFGTWEAVRRLSSRRSARRLEALRNVVINAVRRACERTGVHFIGG